MSIEPRVYIGLTADLLHPGIFNLIKAASNMGAVTVGLLTDAALVGHKQLPIFSWEQRLAMIRGVSGVSDVVAQTEWSYAPNILKLRPDFFVHGDDWADGRDLPLRAAAIEALESYGGTLCEVPFTPGVSMSMLRSQLLQHVSVPELRCALLRRELENSNMVRAIEAHSPAAALVAESTSVVLGGIERKFHAIWSSSLADSVFLGLPDNEVVDFSSRMGNLKEILRVGRLPVIYDGDTGGLADHFSYRVQELERHGVSAIVIEDKTGLKQNSLVADSRIHQLADIEDFANKIHVGKTSQKTKDFQIFARLESLIVGQPMRDAINRASAYVEAGADGIMIHSKSSNADEVIEFARLFRSSGYELPLIAVPTTYSSTSEKVLENAGFNIVIYANQLIRSSLLAMSTVSRGILRYLQSDGVSDLLLPIDELLRFGDRSR